MAEIGRTCDQPQIRVRRLLFLESHFARDIYVPSSHPLRQVLFGIQFAP